MRRVKVYKHQSLDYIIEDMRQYSFDNTTGLFVEPDMEIENGDQISMNCEDAGRIVAKRRHVFFFWRRQYLVARKGDMGVFFDWINERNLTFTKE